MKKTKLNIEKLEKQISNELGLLKTEIVPQDDGFMHFHFHYNIQHKRYEKVIDTNEAGSLKRMGCYRIKINDFLTKFDDLGFEKALVEIIKEIKRDKKKDERFIKTIIDYHLTGNRYTLEQKLILIETEIRIHDDIINSFDIQSQESYQKEIRKSIEQERNRFGYNEITDELIFEGEYIIDLGRIVTVGDMYKIVDEFMMNMENRFTPITLITLAELINEHKKFEE